VYGSGGYESSPDCGVVNAMVRAALAGQTLTIYGQGDRVRDFVHVDDVARAFLVAACSLERCNAQHFALGSGAPMTIADAVTVIASAVENQLGRPVPVTHVDPPADELEIAKYGFAADPEPFARATNFRLKWNFSEGIEETVRYFKNLPASEMQRRK
jgi:nucleoside-diphosphate-sugar epimerase